jgi:hypothetical protein
MGLEEIRLGLNRAEFFSIPALSTISHRDVTPVSYSDREPISSMRFIRLLISKLQVGKQVGEKLE